MNKWRVVYMGTPEFAVRPLAALCGSEQFSLLAVVSQPDRPQGRRAELLPTPVKRCAQGYGVQVLQPTKLKDGSLAAQLTALQPDFILTCAYGRILPAEILRVPRLEALNLHASLLPRYRGAAPIQWALIEGAKQSGVSLMRMDEELDHGAVFSQRSLAIPQEMDQTALSLALSKIAADMALEELPKIARGELTGREQAHTEATFTRQLRREDGLIDWTKDALSLANLVRGTQPWPGAYTFLGAKRLKILRAECLGQAPTQALIDGAAALWPAVEPARWTGLLMKHPEWGLLVCCGTERSGFLRLLEVQAEGGKALAAGAFANGLQGGERLGAHG